MENQNNTTKYELHKQKKELARKKENRRKQLKSFLYFAFGVVAAVVVGLGIVRLLSNKGGAELNKVISRNGIHWHANLEIIVNGVKQEIPANIGIGITHAPLHTHDSDGVVHMEFAGLVTEKDLQLGKFFKIWGKKFSSSCIFEFCNGSGGELKMIVNGNPNNEFENYVMQDGDNIKIIFNKSQ